MLFGDIDGFGFTIVRSLVDVSVAAADRNGNGILDDGDSLPSLGTVTGIGPGSDDIFDNRVSDPDMTDYGLTASCILSIDFSFPLPVLHIVTTGVIFSFPDGDLSVANQGVQAISVDGQLTGAVLTNSYPDSGPPPDDGCVSLVEVSIGSGLVGLVAVVRRRRV